MLTDLGPHFENRCAIKLKIGEDCFWRQRLRKVHGEHSLFLCIFFEAMEFDIIKYHVLTNK